MVGRYIIENEYTINVKLHRETSVDSSHSDYVPTSTGSYSELSNSAQGSATSRKLGHFDDVSNNYTLVFNQPETVILASDDNQPQCGSSPPLPPFLTIVPPIDSQLTSVKVTHLVNGVPEKGEAVSHGINISSSALGSFRSGKDSRIPQSELTKEECVRVNPSVTHISFVSVPRKTEATNSLIPVSVEAKKNPQTQMFSSKERTISPTFYNKLMEIEFPTIEIATSSIWPDGVVQVRGSGPDSSFSINGKHTEGVQLPSVQVYSDDNTLVSKNTYARPKSTTHLGVTPEFVFNNSTRGQVPSTDENDGDKPIRPGSLFVKPIKQHCNKGTGQLYVAPVDTCALLAKQANLLTPLKGNSRRKRNSANETPSKEPFSGQNLPLSEPSISISSASGDHYASEYGRRPNANSEYRGSSEGRNVHRRPKPKSEIYQEFPSPQAREPDPPVRRYSLMNYPCDPNRIGVTSFVSISPTSSPRELHLYDCRPLTNGSYQTLHNGYRSPASSATTRNGSEKRCDENENYISFKNDDHKDRPTCVPSSKGQIRPSTSRTSRRKALARALLTEVLGDQLSFVSYPNHSGHLPFSSGPNLEYDARENWQFNDSQSNADHSQATIHDAYVPRNIDKRSSAEERELVSRFQKETRSSSYNHLPNLHRDRTADVHDPKSVNRQSLHDLGEECLKNSQDFHQLWPNFEEKRGNMIITSEPIISSNPQLQPYNLNHLKELSSGNSYIGNNNAKKYLVNEQHPIYDGHSNLGYEPSVQYRGHDNLGFKEYSPFKDNFTIDPGYGSERSEEEANSISQNQDYSPANEPSRPDTLSSTSFMPPKGVDLSIDYLKSIFHFINEGTIFDLTIIKNSRGLGLSVTGGIECDSSTLPGLIRVKKLYPQTPAWLCGQLHLDDILLEANGKRLTGLTSHEALEVLRTSGTEVHLVVCRAPREVLDGDYGSSHVDQRGSVIISPNIQEPHSIFCYHKLSPSPSFSNCGEFEVQLQKVAGSLGFTLRKNDNSILGHTIRSLVKEPALSDGRIRPGDKLLSVNGTDMCGVSHEEAVQHLRTCPENVIIRLYRDAMQTPVSPASPTEPDIFSSPKQLRKEARDMLSDLAVRKQSSPNLPGNQSTDTLASSRRRRLNKTPSPDNRIGASDRWESLVQEAEKERSLSPGNDSYLGNDGTKENPSDQTAGNSSDVSSSNSTCSTESRPSRPNFLDLSNPLGSSRKSRFTPPPLDDDELFPSPPTTRPYDSLDSVPQLTSTHSDTPAFSHFQSGYRSINIGSLNPHSEQGLTNTSSDNNIHGNAEESPQTKNTLLKWKGVLFTPEEDESNNELFTLDSFYPTPSTEELSSTESSNPKIMTIELNRGWNSRLGFSLQRSNERTTVVAIYEDSIAAKDGRLQIGDTVLEINGTDVQNWTTESVIDLLRKIKGNIILKVIQNPF